MALDTPLWDREEVDKLKRTALVREDFVVIRPGSPANATQAAIELGYEDFNHMSKGYLVYRKAH